MKRIAFFAGLLLRTATVLAQKDTIPISTFFHPQPPSYTVKQAFEIESYVPVFFTGGYHFAACFRSNKLRLRLNVKNGGHYNVEADGLHNTSIDFKRYFGTSTGVLFGYNIWKHLEFYTLLELHTFKIEQKSTGVQKIIRSKDLGVGVCYQFFVGKYFYVLPGMQFYLRTNKSVDFSGTVYDIPHADFSPVISVGARLWSKY